MKKATVLLVMGIITASFIFLATPQVKAQAQRGRPTERMSPEEMTQRMTEFRERMLENTREQLGFSDQEWAAVKPMYIKVTSLQRQVAASGGFGRGFMGRGRRGGERGGDRDQNRRRRPNPFEMNDENEVKALTQAKDALEKVLSEDNSSNEAIAKAMDSYRSARTAAEKDLEAARQALKEVLSVRQEAILVSTGVLR